MNPPNNKPLSKPPPPDFLSALDGDTFGDVLFGAEVEKAYLAERTCGICFLTIIDEAKQIFN
jgi:hypothetical protein